MTSIRNAARAWQALASPRGATAVFAAALVSLATAPDAGADPSPSPSPFTVNPVADGVLTVAGAGFSGVLGLILSTGEIQATPPGPTSNLLSIDRGAVTQKFDKNAGTISTTRIARPTRPRASNPPTPFFRFGRGTPRRSRA